MISKLKKNIQFKNDFTIQLNIKIISLNVYTLQFILKHSVTHAHSHTHKHTLVQYIHIYEDGALKLKQLTCPAK